MSGGGGDGGSSFPSDPWAGAPGSGDGPGGGGGGAADQNLCAALEFDARLRNVDIYELPHVAVGDVLAVVYQEAPTRMVAVFRYLPDGTLSTTPVGALLDRLQELLPCLSILNFEAEVTSLAGGNTRVRVRPA